MIPGILWLASLLALPVIGMPAAFSRPLRSLPLACRIGLACAVGGYVLATMMTLFAVFAIPWRPAVLFAVSLVASALIGRALNRHRSVSGHAPTDGGRLVTAAVCIGAGSVVAAFLSVVAGAATSGDLFLFWGPKAEAFAGVHTISAVFLKRPELQYLHAPYPPLVTNVFAFATMTTERMSWRGATFTFPILAALLALTLPGLLRLRLPRSSAAATTAVIVCGIVLLGMEADIAGNAEMFLLFFETLAMAMLVLPQARRGSIQILAGLLLGGASTAKVEGLPFALAAAVAFFLLRRDRRHPLRCLGRLLGPTAVGTLAWLAFGARTGLFWGYEGYGDFFTVHSAAFPTVLGGIRGALYQVGYGVPFLVPAVMLALRPPSWKPAVVPLVTALALAGFLVFTYIHVPAPAEWLRWSAARVFSPLIPLLALAAAARNGGLDESPSASATPEWAQH